ncbi:hypothetical protein FRC00_003025 [Tulasnella sp. 408]|nr:hypothetical protein FRC00_003025 [Tulasnella sp. 408]
MREMLSNSVPVPLEEGLNHSFVRQCIETLGRMALSLQKYTPSQPMHRHNLIFESELFHGPPPQQHVRGRRFGHQLELSSRSLWYETFTNPEPSYSSYPTSQAKLKAQTLLSLVSNLVRRKADPTFKDSPSAYQKLSKFIQLPKDVLLIIANGMSLTDRARLLQTCRYLRSLLEGAQYRRLHLVKSWKPERAHCLLDTLWERPDLIPCIISYRGVLIPYDECKHCLASTTAIERLKSRLAGRPIAPPPPGNVPFNRTKAIRRAKFIFTRAVNIREIEFTTAGDWPTAPTWQPLRAALSNIPLTHLALPRISATAAVVSLLRAQPRLEHLELSWSATGLEDLNETDIPNLKSLKATLRDAAIIVPGRPIKEYCQIRGGHPFDEQLVRKLSLSSAKITKLTTHFTNQGDPTSVRVHLQILARHLPEIENLTITVQGTVSGSVKMKAGLMLLARLGRHEVDRRKSSAEILLQVTLKFRYFENPPRYQLLHCFRNQNVTGGQSIFVDALQAAQTLWKEDREAFDLLATTDVPFHYVNDGHHLAKRHKTFVIDPSSDPSSSAPPKITAINYSPPFQAPLPSSTPPAFYQALQKFAAMLRRPEGRWEYLLKEGDVAVFDNRRALHARRAFSGGSAAAGKGGACNRWLEGCYVEADAVADRIRVLRTKLRVE